MIHPSAIVELEQLDSTCNVWAYAHVMAGAVIGKRVNLGDHAFVEGGAILGDNVTVKNAVCIWKGVEIADNVFVGPRVLFTNDRYPRSPRMPAARERYSDETNWLVRTVVREGCSIGAGAVICPGVELGAYSMIAAGAVVSRDVPAFAMVAGVPARQVRCVCSCGEPLQGQFDEKSCELCGETPMMRLEMLQDKAVV